MEFNEDKDSITASGDLCCPPLKNVKDGDLKRVYYYSISPNMLLSLHPEYVMYHTVWPDGVDKCKVTCSWLFENDVVKSSKYQTQDAIDFWDMTNKQDWYISELSQLGIQSKKYSPAPYSGQESLLAEFDRYYLENLG
jgi:Rieske 2Fe-2S family protein